MAFMSLAAFAETDISSDPKVSMSTGNVVYGGDDAPALQLLYDGYKMTIDDGNDLNGLEDYKWDGKYYTTSACTVEAGAINKLVVGTYWIKVVGEGVYTGTRTQSFEVTKAEVTVALAGGGLTKVFGAADPEIDADDIAWPTTETARHAAGFVGNDDKTVFNLTSLAYTHEGVNASATPYPVTVTGATADNYTLKITGGITITAKPIAAGMITPVTLSEKYKGAAFTEFAVNIKDGATPLVAGTDFVLGVYSNEAMTTPATPTTVGTYYLGISNKADANYSVAVSPTAVGTFEIEQAGLTVRALNQTKVYNNNNALPDDHTVEVAYQLIGVQGADVFDAPTLTVTGDATVGSKTITPSYTAENPNYDYNYVKGTLTITKRALKIKANNSSKVYKKEDPAGYGGITYTPTLATGEDWEVPATDKSKMTSDKATTGNGQLKVVRTGKGTDENKGKYTGALTLKRNESAAIWDNYDVTLEAGDFEITGGKLYITALKQSKNYGEADPSWTAVEEKKGAVNPNYRVDGISDPDVVTGVTLTCTHEEAVGTYTINIAATGVPTGYEEIVYVPATFKINKRPLAVTAKVQTLKIGDTPANLDQNAYTITTTAANEGLIAGDNASDIFSLTTANPLDAAGKFAKAIVKGAGADLAKAANYEITFEAGNLIVIDPTSTLVLNRPAKAAYKVDPTLDDAAEVIAAAAGSKYDAAGAAAVNTYLPGAWAYGTVKTSGSPATYYADADEYNAANALTDDDFAALSDAEKTKTPAVLYADADEYNAAKGTELTDEQFAALSDAEKTKTLAVLYADADEYNAANALTDDDFAALSDAEKTKTAAVLYADASDYNTDHALTDDDFAALSDDEKTKTAATPDILYTDAEVNAHNAELAGAVKAGDTKKMAVTFGDFAMKAEKWYPIVLPFATSVKEVSEAFGYAIVNILKKDNTDASKIAFKLHMGNIPANEPFVVKIYEDMNMNGAVFGDPTHLANTGKSIVNSDAPEVADASGVKFIGSYSAKTDGFEANEAFFSVSAEKNDYYWGSDKNKTYMAPLSAYFQIPAGSPARTIVFEEPDGTVTAIEAVTTVNDSKINEGMYNLNGVKLNSVPTQKGIYILNGKKVVIK